MLPSFPAVLGRRSNWVGDVSGRWKRGVSAPSLAVVWLSLLGISYWGVTAILTYRAYLTLVI